MSASDVFMLLIRWAHTVAAAAWVGGALFYLLILGPASRRAGEASKPFNTIVAAEFRGLVDTCIVLLVATGAVLAFDRLTGGTAGVGYVTVLGVKSALTLWMFYLALYRRRGRRRAFRGDVAQDAAGPRVRVIRLLTWTNLLVILGIVVFLLSDLLKVLYELALVP